MKNLIKATAISTLALALTGCMSSGPKPAETRVVNFPDAQIMPTPEQVKDPGYRVVVTPVEYNSGVPSSFAEKVYGDVESMLLQAGNKVIDRDLAKQLQRELMVAEEEGRYNTQGVLAADIAVMATVQDVGVGYDFTERRTYEDDGETKVSPAHCDYTATAAVDVKAYYLPSMNPVGTWKFEGRETMSSETSNSRCPLSDTAAASLMSSATNDAVESNMHNLLTPLAPSFYVLERRDGEKGTIFRTNLGTSKGAKAGAAVKLFKLERIPADEYNDEKITRVEIGEGEIIEGVSTDMSYVYVSDKEVVNKIRRGHVVQLLHSECGIGEGEAWIPGLCFNKIIK
ncbi:hypothetical protein C5610_02400 [Idiomarina sp. OT37-5b]|jgi:hypothetical protein|uniref:hypothetical protein n=1 Tax=Idiomarina sp. OT37-5b TaxID=2100422 RepID=UPI000CF9AD98|nr:hypothetical protein [Idiomarina sp. OT37-5b]AVJ55252.1 hypothetical protein C5610_02400 [Idiomarina sp. OT37-5b]